MKIAQQMANTQILTLVLCTYFLQGAFSATKLTVTSSRESVTSKHPNLDNVKDVFWKSLEDTNNASEYGKLTIRSARNTLNAMLNSTEFWTGLESTVRRRVKVASDKDRADRRVATMDAVASMMTDPSMVNGDEPLLLVLASELYNMAVRVESPALTNGLELAIDMVDSGTVGRYLDRVSGVVANVTLSPAALSRGFQVFKKSLNTNGGFKINEAMTTGFMKIASEINKTRKYVT